MPTRVNTKEVTVKMSQAIRVSCPPAKMKMTLPARPTIVVKAENTAPAKIYWSWVKCVSVKNTRICGEAEVMKDISESIES